MPTPIPSGEKAAFIQIVSAAPYPGGPIEAGFLQTILVNYEDVQTAITRQLQLFVQNKSYLIAALDVFDDSAPQAVGIYNGKSVSSVTNPALLVNSTVLEVDLTADPGAGYLGLLLLGSTSVGKVVVSANTTVNDIYIGCGGQVSYLDASAGGAVVQTVWLPFFRNIPSRLGGVALGGTVNTVVSDPGSYFGGFAKDDPNAPCLTPVTLLTTGVVTHNTVQLLWAPPVTGCLFTHIYYRPTGAQDWISATDKTGLFTPNNTGYTFNKLESDSSYEFRIVVICSNGGWSTPSEITVRTPCCGADTTPVNPMVLRSVFLYIKDAPDPTVFITVGKGLKIYAEYAPGNTLQPMVYVDGGAGDYPYLAGKTILWPVFLKTNPYNQDMPYDATTGTFDNTDGGGFNEPDKITINLVDYA